MATFHMEILFMISSSNVATHLICGLSQMSCISYNTVYICLCNTYIYILSKCFGTSKRPYFGWFKAKKRGQNSSRYVNVLEKNQTNTKQTQTSKPLCQASRSSVDELLMTAARAAEQQRRWRVFNLKKWGT